MRLHHYPGLFGDPRSRGLRLAMGGSLVVHLILFATVGRIHTRPAERTFFAPVHFVDLVERSSAPEKPPAAPPAAEKPPTPSPPAPAPKPKPEAAPKQSTVKQKPLVDKEAIQRLLSKVQEPPQQAQPTEKPSEERVLDRIARLREKYGSTSPSREEPSGAGNERSVDEAIASIRERVGPARSSAKASEGSKIGVRSGGANTLQQVRLRAYYNQLWDHVSAHWSIPPSLQGRGYTVIVSVVINRQGRLVRSYIEEPSASSAFDQSALRALKRAEPLPPLPDMVNGDSLEVGFRFSRD